MFQILSFHCEAVLLVFGGNTQRQKRRGRQKETSASQRIIWKNMYCNTPSNVKPVDENQDNSVTDMRHIYESKVILKSQCPGEFMSYFFFNIMFKKLSCTPLWIGKFKSKLTRFMTLQKKCQPSEMLSVSSLTQLRRQQCSSGSTQNV